MYDAPATVGCPSELEFRAQVAARAGTTGRADQTFRVKITSGDAFEGRLTIVDRGETAMRLLSAATCAELGQALALALATALESDEPTPERSQAPSDPPPNPATLAVAPPASASAPSRVPVPVPLPGAGTTDALPRAHTPRRAAAGLAGGPASGLGPLLAPELAVFAELAWGVRTARLNIATSLGGSIPAGDAHGLLRRAALRVDGCPLAWDLGVITPSLCAVVEGGLLVASGRGGASPESTVRPWAAAGVLARARLDVSDRFFFEIETRAAFPFWRDQFFFRPSTDIYTVPVATFATELGTGVRFW